VAREVGLEALGQQERSGQLAQVAERFRQRIHRRCSHVTADVQDVGGQVAQRIVLGDDHALNVHVTVDGDVAGGHDVEHALDVHTRVELGVGVGRDANVHQVGPAAVDGG